MIAIIDYGMGNLRSVFNAFQAVGTEVEVVNNPARLKEASGIVLPGVGAFGDGIRNLRKAGFVDALNEQVLQARKPFLGICLGQQLLGTIGYEHGENPGLDWIPGAVERLSGVDNVRLPHIGWNDVRFVKKDGLYKGLGDTQAFYFVHSFTLKCTKSGVASGLCHYGEDFLASIEDNNIYATQFHPEKSHKHGLAVLKNWAQIVGGSC